MCTILHLHVHIRSKYCYTLVCFFLSVADVSGTQFWRYPFVNLCSPKRFVEFMVMQVDIVPEKDRPHRVPVSNKVRGITCNMYFILYSSYKSIGMCKGASKQFADFKNYITCWVLKVLDPPLICFVQY